MTPTAVRSPPGRRRPRVRSAARAPVALVLVLAAACATPSPPPPTAVPAPAAPAPPAAAEGRFQILQINDVYKIEGLEDGAVGGLARVRELRRRLEAAAPEKGPVVVLHGGDLLWPSVMSKYFEARPMIDVLDRLDGDPDGFDERLLVTFGNHEFDGSTPDLLAARLADSDFRWLASNVFYRPPGSAAAEPFRRTFGNVHHTLVLELGGLRVGFFGLVLDDATRDYVLYDDEPDTRAAAVRGALAALADQEAELVVALTHQELADDVELARAFPSIDLVVGGHEHVCQREEVAGTWITKADADARTAVVIEVDARDPARPVVEPRWVELDASVAPDPTVAGRVAEWVDRLATTVAGYRDVHGTTVHRLDGEEAAIRGRETALGNWLVDVVRERMGTDVAFVHGGSIRINDNVPAGGEIRGEHLEGIFYYDGSLVAFDLSGRELLDLLANSVSRVDAGAGRFLQVSGLRLAYQATADGTALDPASVEVRAVDGGWQPLDPEATYSAATLRYLWENGYRDGYELFSVGDGGTSPLLTAGADGEIGWRATTEKWLEENGRVTTDVEGRIVRRGEATERACAPAGG